MAVPFRQNFAAESRVPDNGLHRGRQSAILSAAIGGFFGVGSVTYSISHGIGYGRLTLVSMQIVNLRFREVHPLLFGAAAVFSVAILWG